ncbi:MAG: hypothetical protein AAFU53_02825, partial [Cyanobacteria bacterium J06632_3]
GLKNSELKPINLPGNLLCKRSYLNIDIGLSFSLIRKLDLIRHLTYSLDLLCSVCVTLGLDRNLVHELELTYNFARADDYSVVREREPDLDEVLARTLDVASKFSITDIFDSVDFKLLVQSVKEKEKEKPGEESSFLEKERFVESIYDLWFSTFHIKVELTSISSQEAQSLSNYCYICELMIRCKENATRVSPDVWESIESSILAVPE